MKKNAVLFSAGEYLNSRTFPKPNCDLSGVKYDILAIEKRLKQIGFNVIKKKMQTNLSIFLPYNSVQINRPQMPFTLFIFLDTVVTTMERTLFTHLTLRHNMILLTI